MIDTTSLQTIANAALDRWPLPDGATATLINISENATFRVDDPATGKRWAMRLHRPGYHSPTAVASELAWSKALRDSGTVLTPAALQGRDGGLIQSIAHPLLPRPRMAVLFDWEEGREPTLGDRAAFETLGGIAARMHAHVRTWEQPRWFDRHTWNLETALGPRGHWGDWRKGIGVTPEIAAVFERTVVRVGNRLSRFGDGPERFGLVHGDMRLTNLLIDGGKVKVIDFDDCGFSWNIYDAAVTVSFAEHAPEVPDLLAAWAQGYRRVQPLSSADETEIATLLMLRRLLLVAWIGTHQDSEFARSLGAGYTEATVPLCERFLSAMRG